MYCISTNLPGPPRHVNHRGEDYYKSATSYSTYLCTAPTTKGNAYNAATTIVMDSAAAATYDRLPPQPTGPFDTKKSQVEKACTVRRVLRTSHCNWYIRTT